MHLQPKVDLKAIHKTVLFQNMAVQKQSQCTFLEKRQISHIFTLVHILKNMNNVKKKPSRILPFPSKKKKK